MIQNMNNPTLGAFDPLTLSYAEQQRILQAQQAQSDALQPTQNSGYQGTDNVQQPIPPLGAPGGPVSVGPATWAGGIPGVPAVPPSMSAPLPPRRPANLGNAGQGFNNFKAGAGAHTQPLQAPQSPQAPQSQSQPQTQPASNGSQHQSNIIDALLKAFGVQGGLAGIAQNIGNGINHFGQDVSHGLDGIFNQHAQAAPAQQAAPQAAPAQPNGQMQNLSQLTGGPTPNWQVADPTANAGQIADLTKLTGGVAPNWKLDLGALGGMFNS